MGDIAADHHERVGGLIPVDQDFADLDALAAGPQRVLHGLPAADDGHAAQALGKVHPHVLLPRGCGDCLLREGQVPQASLDYLHATPQLPTQELSRFLSSGMSLLLLELPSFKAAR